MPKSRSSVIRSRTTKQTRTPTEDTVSSNGDSSRSDKKNKARESSSGMNSATKRKNATSVNTQMKKKTLTCEKSDMEKKTILSRDTAGNKKGSNSLKKPVKEESGAKHQAPRSSSSKKHSKSTEKKVADQEQTVIDAPEEEPDKLVATWLATHHSGNCEVDGNGELKKFKKDRVDSSNVDKTKEKSRENKAASSCQKIDHKEKKTEKSEKAEKRKHSESSKSNEKMKIYKTCKSSDSSESGTSTKFEASYERERTTKSGRSINKRKEVVKTKPAHDEKKDFATKSRDDSANPGDVSTNDKSEGLNSESKKYNSSNGYGEEAVRPVRTAAKPRPGYAFRSFPMVRPYNPKEVLYPSSDEDEDEEEDEEDDSDAEAEDDADASVEDTDLARSADKPGCV